MCRSWGVTQRAVRTAIEVPMSGVNRYTNIVNDIRFVRVAISHNVTLLRSVPCRFFCSASRHFHTSLVSFISLNLTTLLRFVPYRLFYTAKRHFLCSFVSFTSLSKKVSRRTLALARLGHPRSSLTQGFATYDRSRRELNYFVNFTCNVRLVFRSLGALKLLARKKDLRRDHG